MWVFRRSWEHASAKLLIRTQLLGYLSWRQSDQPQFKQVVVDIYQQHDLLFPMVVGPDFRP
ncbi:hypothetical protein G352_22421 [Rhodococcus ruber BKS 20-38]|uniref:Uncharacterized protein n=1 Tax=Rhodococcus ruber BKS 20-38 TaxID=1278076 RepID=M2X4P9_9NOCA|nr:hypothetical protein G352_22421 [Rhodococcus ruber BKS 20-38]